MKKFCKGCGEKIPRKIPHTDRKTNQSRQLCFNCSPFKEPIKYLQKHKSERRKRKEALVKMLGGHCARCGYHKSIGALSFHHKNPKDKSFEISHNGNMMQDWEIVEAEARKCSLLCLNCHAEIHTKNG